MVASGSGMYSAFWHLVHFLAPALWMALAFPTVAWLRKSPGSMAWKTQVLAHFLLGSAVLTAGVLLLGRDGKMATYLALVAVGATAQTFFGCRKRH